MIVSSRLFRPALPSVRGGKRVKDIKTSLSARGNKIPSRHAHRPALVGSALLNIWEYCHRTVEVHRANELEPLSTSGGRTPRRLFARSKPGWSPREEWIGQFFKKCSFNNPAQSAVDGDVDGCPPPSRTEITARSENRFAFLISTLATVCLRERWFIMKDVCSRHKSSASKLTFLFEIVQHVASSSSFTTL